MLGSGIKLIQERFQFLSLEVFLTEFSVLKQYKVISKNSDDHQR